MLTASDRRRESCPDCETERTRQIGPRCLTCDGRGYIQRPVLQRIGFNGPAWVPERRPA